MIDDSHDTGRWREKGNTHTLLAFVQFPLPSCPTVPYHLSHAHCPSHLARVSWHAYLPCPTDQGDHDIDQWSFISLILVGIEILLSYSPVSACISSLCSKHQIMLHLLSLAGMFGKLCIFNVAGALNIINSGTKTWRSDCWYTSLLDLGASGLTWKGRRPSYQRACRQWGRFVRRWNQGALQKLRSPWGTSSGGDIITIL